MMLPSSLDDESDSDEDDDSSRIESKINLLRIGGVAPPSSLGDSSEEEDDDEEGDGMLYGAKRK